MNTAISSRSSWPPWCRPWTVEPTVARRMVPRETTSPRFTRLTSFRVRRVQAASGRAAVSIFDSVRPVSSAASRAVDVDRVGGEADDEKEEDERRPGGGPPDPVSLGVEEDGRRHRCRDHEGRKKLAWRKTVHAEEANPGSRVRPDRRPGTTGRSWPAAACRSSSKHRPRRLSRVDDETGAVSSTTQTDTVDRGAMRRSSATPFESRTPARSRPFELRAPAGPGWRTRGSGRARGVRGWSSRG
jgi:hypothetical protein